MKMKGWTQGVTAGLLALVASAAMSGPGLEITDAWVRALPPGQPATAAYLTVTNPGAEAVTVEAASADRAKRVEMHDTREVDGMLRMRQQASVTIPAGGELRFAPGGLHLMLLGLEQMPREGESVRLCLHSGDTRHCTQATVRRDAEPGDGHQHHQH